MSSHIIFQAVSLLVDGQTDFIIFARKQEASSKDEATWRAFRSNIGIGGA